ncbi:MAG: hypothetical protein NVSMB33_10960 [Ktedonobacteraceae bacterium]
MVSDGQECLINYYEVLAVAENASSLDIQNALLKYRASLEAQLNNPLSMGPARSAMNSIIPAIESTLLSDERTRLAYDQCLIEVRKRQQTGYEPSDQEGLDDVLRVPFLFKPLENFDTEIPAYTLRNIAMKLDTEWSDARAWITDTTNEIHAFVSYLTFVANRRHLAKRIGSIIEAVAPHQKQRMDINEGIERCIDILDPRTERPGVGIHNRTFDGKVFDAGTFISDMPAHTELILGHEGVRGCAFGSVESHTDWLTFEYGQKSVRFTLMPEERKAPFGVSEVKIPLYFKVSKLPRNMSHTALLVLHMENQATVIEQPVQVAIHVQALPPRVAFEPVLSPGAPYWAGRVLRGVAAQLVVTPRNYGDEDRLPLVARIATNDDAVRVTPGEFRANQSITITVDTSKRPFDQHYTIPFDISYTTAGARGPASIVVQGALLPTPWQSMLREKSLGERAGVGCAAGIGSLLLFSILGIGIAQHASFGWLLLLLIPVLFTVATHLIMSTVIMHMHRSGDTSVQMEKIAPWKRWGIPVAAGLLIVLLCALISDASIALFIDVLAGFILGSALGFMLDKSRAKEPNNVAVPPMTTPIR